MTKGKFAYTSIDRVQHLSVSFMLICLQELKLKR